MRGSALVAALIVISSGCLGREEGTSRPVDPVDAPPEAGDEAPDVAPPAAELRHVVRYFNANMEYAIEAPPDGEPQRVPLPAFVPFAVTGGGFPHWVGNPAHPTVAITEAAVVFYYTQGTPGRRDASFPPFGALWGARDGMQLVTFAEGPDTIMPGEVLEARVEMALPPGGLVLREGIPSTSAVFAIYQPSVDGVTQGAALVWSTATPSHLELTAQNITLPEATERVLLSETGDVSGGACYGADAGTATAAFPFDVPAGAVGLRAELVRTGGEGQEDMDLNLVGPNGDVVPGGNTPFATEIVDLYQPNLQAIGAGAWEARVVACGLQSGTFELSVTVSEPAAASDSSA